MYLLISRAMHFFYNISYDIIVIMQYIYVMIDE